MKYTKKFRADDTLKSISMQAGQDATLQNAREFDVLRRSTPQVITVDETGKTPKVRGYMTYDDKQFEHDPWRMYQYRPSENEPQGDPTKTAAGRSVYVREVLPGGTTRITEKDAFQKADSRTIDGKKTKNATAYFDQLYQLTRSGAQTAEEYETGLYRTQIAADNFENNKYIIEQKAALAQVPPAMLGAALFHLYGDIGNRSAQLPLSDAALNELVRGSDLANSGMHPDALREYSKTTEGMTELAAYLLQSEAKKRGYDLSALKGTQQQEILAAFNRKLNVSDKKGALTEQMVSVFEDLFAALPGKERAATWQEDSDRYYNYEDVFLG